LYNHQLGSYIVFIGGFILNDQTVGLGSFKKKSLLSALAIVVATSLVAPVAFGEAAPATATGTEGAATTSTSTATTSTATTSAATTTAATTTAATTAVATGTGIGALTTLPLITTIIVGGAVTLVGVTLNDAAEESGVPAGDGDGGGDGTTDTGTTGTTDTGTTDTGTTSTASTASTGT
jgi:hypothetical protein